MTETNHIKVSIIMPAYNSEKYIGDAIRSVCEQDFEEEYELIVIDDGSTDGTYKVCKQLSEKYPQLVIIKKENGGISSARNVGLENAKGEYIGFCDNDDVYGEHALSQNYRLAMKTNADIVRWSYKEVHIDGEEIATVREKKVEDGIYSNLQEMYAGYENIWKLMGAVWTGLYRRSLIEEYGVRFDETMRFGGEDLNFNLKMIKHCTSIIISSKVFYQWKVRVNHSTSHKRDENFCETMIKNAKLEYEFLLGKCSCWNDWIKDWYKKYIQVYANAISTKCGKKYRWILRFPFWYKWKF